MSLNINKAVLVSNITMALVDHTYLIEKLSELPCSTKREENYPPCVCSSELNITQ